MTVKKFKVAIMKKGNKDLGNFIYENFGEKRSANEKTNNLQILKMLPNDVLIFGIARMEQIETDYDHSKYFPSLIAILGIMFGIYKLVLNEYWVFYLGTGASLFLLWSMKKERRIRAGAVYFRSLLIQIKDLKKPLK